MSRALAAAVTIVVMAAPASAEPRGPFCTGTIALTDGAAGTSSARSSVSATGRWVAFESTADLTGDNEDGGWEVFLLDTTTGSTSQLTRGSGDSRSPSISGNGALVAFQTPFDATDGGGDIAVYDRFTHATTRVTDTVAADSTEDPALSQDGSTIVFTSEADLTGDNPSGNGQIFTYDVSDHGFTQVTPNDPERRNGTPSVSADGTRIVFSSQSLVFGSYQVFLLDTGTGFARRVSTSEQQMSQSWVQSNAAISADGTDVVFGSDWNHVTDDGTSGDFDAVLHHDPTRAYTQVTDSPAWGYDAVNGTTISADGEWIAFSEYVRLDPEEPAGGFQALLYEVASGATTQLTDSPPLVSNGAPALSAVGGRVVWSSSDDVTGGNADGSSELLTQACWPRPTDVSPSHPFSADIVWMGEQGISTGYADGSYRPAAPVTRAAMAAFLYRLAGEPEHEPPAEATFGDVSPNHPFFPEIEWMATAGISTGTPASPKPRFEPAGAVSRQAMSAFLHRLAGEPELDPPVEATFGDVSPNHPFFPEIEWMASEGISTGTAASPKPLFLPASAVSRQAMSAFLHRLADGPGVHL